MIVMWGKPLEVRACLQTPHWGSKVAQVNFMRGKPLAVSQVLVLFIHVDADDRHGLSI